MRKFQLALVLVLLGGITNLLAQVTPVATVRFGNKSDIITRDDFNSRLQVFELQAGRKLTSEEQKQLLQAHISEVLFYQAALEAGKKVSENELIATLKQQVPGAEGLSVAQFKELYSKEVGVPWDVAKEQLERGYLAQKYLREKAQPLLAKIKEPSESELRLYYEKNKAQIVSPDLVLVKHIFLPLEGKKEADVLNQMNKIWEEINKKEISFADAVLKYSQDKGSKTNGGILGGTYLTYNNPQAERILGDSFVKVAMEMKEKAISKPLKSPSGYHIIFIERKIPAKILAYEDVLPYNEKMTVKDSLKEQIRVVQEQAAMRQALETTTADLEKRASIQILDKTLL